MSDREELVYMLTHAERGDVIRLYMDGESGTWRLFADKHGACGTNVDFTLATLKEFSARLLNALKDIEADPEALNAEVRAARIDA